MMKEGEKIVAGGSAKLQEYHKCNIELERTARKPREVVVMSRK